MTEKPFAEWIGRKSESEDIITPRLVASFRATFEPNLSPVGDGDAPLGLHWCLSPPIAPMDGLGGDGHPALNRDLPPVPQPRRMWAGGAVESFAPLKVGDKVTRVSTIRDIVRKEGRTGELWFVTVGHDYLTDRGLAIRERHDIVYREAADPAKPQPVPEPGPSRPSRADWLVQTPPTLLFRYSAITFNGHRIHYDLPYVTQVEGYEGLVVHGPIQATLLFNLAARVGGGVPKSFSYRGLAPAIGGRPILVRAGAGEADGVFWTQGSAGQVHMEARIGH
jgi:3-methylfumaryl-CoA hydratase